jgi:hypothetical protein
MMMRPQKTQLPSVYKWDGPVLTSWNNGLHMIAGYRTYEAMVVGAAGGRSGTSSGKQNNGQTIRSDAAGGGGGGAHKVSGNLADLPVTVGVIAGQAGGDGADHTTASSGRAGDGEDGGISSFGGVAQATGGYGGEGGYTRPGGGSERAMPGAGGVGAAGGTPGEVANNDDGTAVTFPGGFSSGGGLGGYGKIQIPDITQNATAGGDGASNLPDNIASGQFPDGNKGGGGGGARLKIGENDALWRGQATVAAPYCHGGVLLVIS